MQGRLYLGPKRGGSGLCGSSTDETKAPPSVKDVHRNTKSKSVESKDSKEKDESTAPSTPSPPPSSDSKSALSFPRPSTTMRGSIHVQRSSLIGMAELSPLQQEERLRESNKVKYWNCRLHRLILHRYVSTSGERRKRYKYVDATQDYPIAIDQLVGVTATQQLNPNKPSKIYLEFSDGSEFKCKVDSMDEFNVWFDLLKIFIEYHQQLPHTGLKYTYKTYPIPSLYKTALIDCFNYIREHGVHEEGIFRAGKTDVEQLRQIIIGGGLDPNKTHDVLGVAFVCKSILRSLPETLLTAYLLPHCMDAARDRNMNDLITCIRDLPQDNREILQLMLETCILCCQSATSKMTVESMAKVVGPNFLDTEDPALLMQIKTGELPLIQLFDMLMYNMRQIFGEGAIQMPKKRKNADLGLSPKMEALAPADSAVIFVDEKKEKEKEKSRREKEQRERELQEKEQREREQRERERREKELRNAEEKEKSEREQREREQREKEEREANEKKAKEEEERKRQNEEEEEEEEEEERERERNQKERMESEASIPNITQSTDVGDVSQRVDTAPNFHSSDDVDAESNPLNHPNVETDLIAEFTDAPISSPVGFTLHEGLNDDENETE